jgi:cyclophilin family peptidyl-prolyl cis-trans isomerase
MPLLFLITLALGPRAIVIHTNAGDLRGMLFERLAPKTVAQFARIANAGVLDTVWFVRIEPGFVVQTTTAGGRLRTLTPAESQLLGCIPLEVSALKHRRGALSMPHPDHNPNCGESSLVIVLGDAAHLDGKYTVFGMVDPADKLLAGIESTGTRPRDQRPRIDVNHVEVR